MKSTIKNCVTILIMVLLLSLTSQTFAVAFAEETTLSGINISHDTVSYKNEMVEDFMLDGHIVAKETIITDFAGNQFIVYELEPSGYAIYSIKNEAKIFIEGSYKVNSLFKKHYTHEIYYGGVGCYYCREEDQIIDLVSEENIHDDQVVEAYTLDNNAYIEKFEVEPFASFPKNPDSSKTHTEDGFTVINNDDYFRNLTEFPDNTVGTCGLVGISILLGYFDEYVDNAFITKNEYKDGVGTSQKLHDDLFNKYMHTILGIKDQNQGYPMAGYEIQETMKDYLKNECSETLRKKVKHEYSSLFYTHATPRKHINGGYPTLLVLTKYNKRTLTLDKGQFDKNHVVVAYGYNKSNDTFLVHMGWQPGFYNYTEIIISNATIHSYYTINYTA